MCAGKPQVDGQCGGKQHGAGGDLPHPAQRGLPAATLPGLRLPAAAAPHTLTKCVDYFIMVSNLPIAGAIL